MINRATGFRRQALGMTLVELMVAMTIGLALTIVIAQLFLGSKQAFNSTDSLSRVQENARYALTLLGRQARSARFLSDPRNWLNPDLVFVPATTPAITGTDGGITSGSGVPDSITLRFQGSGNGTGTPDMSVQDCIGGGVDYNAMSMSTFLIKNDTTNNNEPTLYCNTVTTACVAATCYPLVPGVENMQILYNENVTVDPANPSSRWVTANNVGNWDQVIGVRISLLLRTQDGVNTGTDTKSYLMSSTNVNAPGTDRRMRRIYTSVVDLRNRTN